MARNGSALAKKSLVVDEAELARWVRVGRYRNASEAVRSAVSEILAIRDLRQAIDRIRRRGTFGRHVER